MMITKNELLQWKREQKRLRKSTVNKMLHDKIPVTVAQQTIAICNRTLSRINRHLDERLTATGRKHGQQSRF